MHVAFAGLRTDSQRSWQRSMTSVARDQVEIAPANLVGLAFYFRCGGCESWIVVAELPSGIQCVVYGRRRNTRR